MSDLPFSVGDRVHVRKGVKDPDFPSLLLEGWKGVVSDVDSTIEPPLFLVEWDESTLEAMPSRLGRRCARDGMEWYRIWLNADHLEPDQSVVREVPEQPPLPLDLNDPEERALYALGLTSEDDLPAVNSENLRRYHAYLKRKLRFPFPAALDLSAADIGSGLSPVIVMQLLPPEQAHFPVGLLAEVAMPEGIGHIPLAVLIPAPGDASEADLTAYTRWIGESLPPAPQQQVFRSFVLLGVVSALAGGVAGAAIATVSGGVMGAWIGAVLVAIVGFVLGVRLEMMTRQMNNLPPGYIGGALMGFLFGGAVGAAVAALVLCYFGSIPGAMAGTAAYWLLSKQGVRLPRFWLPVIGAAVGTLTASLLLNFWAGLIGFGIGLLAGGVLGVGLVGSAVAYLGAVFRHNPA